MTTGVGGMTPATAMSEMTEEKTGETLTNFDFALSQSIPSIVYISIAFHSHINLLPSIYAVQECDRFVFFGPSRREDRRDSGREDPPNDRREKPKA